MCIFYLFTYLFKFRLAFELAAVVVAKVLQCLLLLVFYLLENYINFVKYMIMYWIVLALFGGFEGLLILPFIMFGWKAMITKNQSTCKAVLDGLGCKHDPKLTVTDTAKMLWSCSWYAFNLLCCLLVVYIE